MPDDPVCDKNTEYMLCVGIVQRDLVTATAAISALVTFLMGASCAPYTLRALTEM